MNGQAPPLPRVGSWEVQERPVPEIWSTRGRLGGVAAEGSGEGEGGRKPEGPTFRNNVPGVGDTPWRERERERERVGEEEVRRELVNERRCK